MCQDKFIKKISKVFDFFYGFDRIISGDELLMLLHLEGNELDKIIKANEKVLVDFYADWCMPCKMLGGYIEELVLEHPEMMVAKVNVDNNQEAFEKYGEESIPLLLMFKNGRLIKKIVGFIPKANVWRLYNE